MNPNASSDVVPAGQPIDLTNCDREPIHMPGSIQPHGCLLACDYAARTVLFRSDNAGAMLGLSGDCLGKSLSEVIGGQTAHTLLNALAVAGSRPHPAVVFGVEVNGRNHDATIHRHDKRTIIEFEAAALRPGQVISLSRTVIERLRATRTVGQLVEQAAFLMQAQLGYDRVMVYQLGEDGAGKVISEAKTDQLESFRGQYFPAGDIPRQARALYLLNPIRVIGDVAFTPVPVRALENRSGPLDLSHSHLRSVSPIHCEYLANMGVSASMSVSIIIDGALWGLVACHHYSPKVLSMAERATAELVGEVLAMHLDALGRQQARDAELAARAALDDLVVDASRTKDAGLALQTRLPQLGGLIAADGAAMWLDGVWTATGEAPTRDQAGPLLALASERADGQVFQTAQLARLLPDAPDLTAIAAGLMIVPLSRRPRDFLFYFRKEAEQTLDWAGDPNKTYETGRFGDRLTPRKSFAIWKETVRHTSQPWTEADRRFADALRMAVVEVLLFNNEMLSDERSRAAVRQRVLNRELNHRVKNILAVIQALVARKPAPGQRLDDYVQTLQGRIRALAHAHDQVISTDGGGLLGDLLDAELGPFCSDGGAITLDGPPVALDGHAFSVMALIFHEMATNAAKYGALSHPGGRLAIRWAMDDNGRCRIDWDESGLHDLAPPTRTGFGSALVEQSLPFDLGGESRIEFRPTGVAACFILPATSVRGAAGVAPVDRDRTPASLPPPPESGPAGRRVLVVEDQTLIAMALEADLQDRGLEVVGRAATVDAALRHIDRDPPDLAVLDVNLSDTHSLPVAERLQSLNIPFVFATGFGADFERPEQFAAVPLVGKPYRAAEVVARLTEAERRLAGSSA